MKNTQIAAAIDALVNAVRALETELEAAKETTTARDDALKGWIAVADERARRLSSLQDDMQGMVSVLNDEHAQNTAKIKALETQCTELNCALRSADEEVANLIDQLAETRKLVVAQRLVINDLQAQQ